MKNLYDLSRLVRVPLGIPWDRLAIELHRRKVIEYHPRSQTWRPLNMDLLDGSLKELYLYKYTLGYYLKPLFLGLKRIIKGERS